MNDKQRSKIERFMRSADSNTMAMVAAYYSVDNTLHIEAQGNDNAIGEIYMAVYHQVKDMMEQGAITEKEEELRK